MDTVQNGIANLLRDDPDIMDLLPGGVWTREIKRNDNAGNPDLPPSPGSTPEAFDAAGRIRRCAAVLSGDPQVTQPLGPKGAYMGFPQIWLRCLPHETDKQALHQAARLIMLKLQDRVLTGLGGEGLSLTIAERMMPVDDPVIDNCVVDMIRVQVDSIWR